MKLLISLCSVGSIGLASKKALVQDRCCMSSDLNIELQLHIVQPKEVRHNTKEAFICRKGNYHVNGTRRLIKCSVYNLFLINVVLINNCMYNNAIKPIIVILFFEKGTYELYNVEGCIVGSILILNSRDVTHSQAYHVWFLCISLSYPSRFDIIKNICIDVLETGSNRSRVIEKNA